MKLKGFKNNIVVNLIDLSQPTGVAQLATDPYIPTLGLLGSRVRDVVTPPLSDPKCWEGICHQGSLSDGELGGRIPSSVRGTVHLPFL
ncbi:hypothetical protein Hanom_Chr05g00435581 [Helianthus anomalus]